MRGARVGIEELLAKADVLLDLFKARLALPAGGVAHPCPPRPLRGCDTVFFEISNAKSGLALQKINFLGILEVVLVSITSRICV